VGFKLFKEQKIKNTQRKTIIEFNFTDQEARIKTCPLFIVAHSTLCFWKIHV